MAAVEHGRSPAYVAAVADYERPHDQAVSRQTDYDAAVIRALLAAGA